MLLVEDRAIDAAGSAGALRLLTLSAPDKKNALDRDTLDELVVAVRAPPSVRVIVLRGDPAGGAFSAGYNIAHIDDAERARGLDPIRAPADAIEASTRPVIACIDGPCMGGAFELAMACTLRVASTRSRFAMPPARLGLVYSASGLVRFLRAARPSAVQRLFLTAEAIDAGAAQTIGLVDDVVDDAAARALDIAARIANNAPLAVAGLCEAIRRCADGVDADDLARIDELREATVHSTDLAEGVAAFLEKRAPRFRGA